MNMTCKVGGGEGGGVINFSHEVFLDYHQLVYLYITKVFGGGDKNEKCKVCAFAATTIRSAC